MFTIIGALSQLKRPILAVAETTERYTEFRRSYDNMKIFLDQVPDFPKMNVQKILASD